MKPILNHSKSWLTEEMIENFDGFLLGDGCINYRNRPSLCASATVKHKEFGEYFAQIFCSYAPSVKPGISPAHLSSAIGYVKKCRNVRFVTKSHPDFTTQRNRWYPGGIKEVPTDVRITPKSLLLWYLGDGTLYLDKGISPYVTFYTNSFSQTSIDILRAKLSDLGMSHWYLPNNTIRLKTPAVKLLFDMIGRESPVECYSYKFNVPEHLWLTKSLDVQNMLGMKKHSFHRLLKKSGIRSEMGGKHKFFYFTNDMIERLRRLCD